MKTQVSIDGAALLEITKELADVLVKHNVEVVTKYFVSDAPATTVTPEYAKWLTDLKEHCDEHFKAGKFARSRVIRYRPYTHHSASDVSAFLNTAEELGDIIQIGGAGGRYWCFKVPA